MSRNLPPNRRRMESLDELRHHLDARFDLIQRHVDDRIDRIEAMIKTLGTAPSDVVSVQEAATILKRSVGAVYHLKKELKGSRKGGRIYFSRKVLEQWMLSNPSQTLAELVSEAKRGRRR